MDLQGFFGMFVLKEMLHKTIDVGWWFQCVWGK